MGHSFLRVGVRILGVEEMQNHLNANREVKVKWCVKHVWACPIVIEHPVPIYVLVNNKGGSIYIRVFETTCK